MFNVSATISSDFITSKSNKLVASVNINEIVRALKKRDRCSEL